MFDSDGYSKRYNIMFNKEKSIVKQPTSINQIISTKNLICEQQQNLIYQGSKNKNKQIPISIDNTKSSSTIATQKKKYKKQQSLSKNLGYSEIQSKYSTRRHSRLNSEATAQTTKKKESILIELNQDSQLSKIYDRVNKVLSDYKKKQQKWQREKQGYQKKIALLVNQLARSERLRI